MRLARIVSAVPILAILGWGCSQDTTSPRGIVADRSPSPATTTADVEYKTDPPRVAVSADMAVPNGLPYCRIGGGFKLICYAPNFLRAAYNFPPVGTLDGSGQTILLVEAFGSPTIAADLAVFDAIFNIPAPPSFTVLCPPQGCPPFNPSDTKHNEIGWSVETSLDVEYAHAMAPGANIVLVVATTSSGDAINQQEQRAIALYPGSVMSQSFGTPEIVARGNRQHFIQAHHNYEAAQEAGITVLASAGDLGATNGFATANPQYPASDPLVTSVGGTQGNPYITFSTARLSCDAGQTCSSGLATFIGPCNSDHGFLNSPCAPTGYGGEQVWNEAVFAPGSTTGGAPSLIFPVPDFQAGLGLTTRTVPDVSYNAAIQGGVLVANSTILGTPAFFIIGGTSAGSPQWAAIIALANQLAGHSLGYLNPGIYALAQSSSRDFHDITVGNNQMPGTPVGFPATAGWDDATGWGTPNVSCFLADLTGKAVPTCQ